MLLGTRISLHGCGARSRETSSGHPRARAGARARGAHGGGGRHVHFQFARERTERWRRVVQHVSQSVRYFTVPPRAHPTGSQSGSAAPGLTQVPSSRSRGLTQLSQVRSVSPSGQGVPCRFLPCTARGSSPLRAGLGVAPRVLFRPFVYLNTRDRGPAAVLVLFRLSCYTHPAVVCVM